MLRFTQFDAGEVAFVRMGMSFLFRIKHAPMPRRKSQHLTLMLYHNPPSQNSKTFLIVLVSII